MRALFLLLIVLASCVSLPERGEQVVSKPVVPAATGVMALPAKQQPQVLQSTQKVPQEHLTPKINVTVAPPPQPISCKEQCENDCDQSAQLACTQKDRVACKANCGDIADPSACSQACSFLSQPTACEGILNKACTSQCVGLCH